jgi:hypothetical protein
VGLFDKGKIRILGAAGSDHGEDSRKKAGASDINLLEIPDTGPPAIPVEKNLIRIAGAGSLNERKVRPGEGFPEALGKGSSHVGRRRLLN